VTRFALVPTTEPNPALQKKLEVLAQGFDL